MAEIIWEDVDFLAFLGVPPDNPGHAVVATKHHFESVFALQEPLYSKFFQTAKCLYQPLKESVGAADVAVNFGTVGCGHVHINLVPVNESDLRFPHGPIEMNESQLAETAKRIRNVIAANSNGGIQQIVGREPRERVSHEA